MEELRRINRKEIPKSKRWQRDAAWEIELATAQSWLDDHANEAASKNDTTFEHAIAYGATLADRIHALFGAEGSAHDARLINEVETGVVERTAPSVGVIASVALFKYLCMASEILIFGYMWWNGMTNYIAIILGGLLAVGGYIAGLGGGRLIVRREHGKDVKDLLAWLLLATGVGLIAVVSWLRTLGQEEGVQAIVGITASLAVAVAISELFHYTLTSRYREQREKMFLYQQWFSTNRFVREYENRLWQKTYEAAVKNHWRNRRPAPLSNVTRPAESRSDAAAPTGSSIPTTSPAPPIDAPDLRQPHAGEEN
jgi:hypothetical protein